MTPRATPSSLSLPPELAQQVLEHLCDGLAADAASDAGPHPLTPSEAAASDSAAAARRTLAGLCSFNKAICARATRALYARVVVTNTNFARLTAGAHHVRHVVFASLPFDPSPALFPNAARLSFGPWWYLDLADWAHAALAAGARSAPHPLISQLSRLHPEAVCVTLPSPALKEAYIARYARARHPHHLAGGRSVTQVGAARWRQLVGGGALVWLQTLCAAWYPASPPEEAAEVDGLEVALHGYALAAVPGFPCARLRIFPPPLDVRGWWRAGDALVRVADAMQSAEIRGGAWVWLAPVTVELAVDAERECRCGAYEAARGAWAALLQEWMGARVRLSVTPGACACCGVAPARDTAAARTDMCSLDECPEGSEHGWMPMFAPEHEIDVEELGTGMDFTPEEEVWEEYCSPAPGTTFHGSWPYHT